MKYKIIEKKKAFINKTFTPADFDTGQGLLWDDKYLYIVVLDMSGKKLLLTSDGNLISCTLSEFLILHQNVEKVELELTVIKTV